MSWMVHIQKVSIFSLCVGVRCSLSGFVPQTVKSVTKVVCSIIFLHVSLEFDQKVGYLRKSFHFHVGK